MLCYLKLCKVESMYEVSAKQINFVNHLRVESIQKRKECIITNIYIWIIM